MKSIFEGRAERDPQKVLRLIAIAIVEISDSCHDQNYAEILLDPTANVDPWL